MQTFILPCFFLLFLTTWSQAQNLIPNPSFELHNIPEKQLQRNYSFTLNTFDSSEPSILYWRAARANDGNTQVRNNHQTVHLIKSGRRFSKYSLAAINTPAQDGYFMLVLSADQYFLSTPLTEKLKKGKNYRLSYYLRKPAKYAGTGSHMGSFSLAHQQEHFVDTIRDNAQYVLRSRDRRQIPAPRIPLPSREDSTIVGDPQPKYWKQFTTDFIAQDTFAYIAFGLGGVMGISYTQDQTNVDNIQLHCLDCSPDSASLEDKEVDLDGLAKQIHFETQSSVLTAEAKAALEKAVPQLQQAMNETSLLKVEGHTDNVGEAQANLELSKARAEAIKQFLVGKGFSAAQIETQGYGETQPLADNSTETGRAQNRRVEIQLRK